MSQYFEYMGVGEFARAVDKSPRQVRNMVQNGLLTETGHKIKTIASKSGKRKVGQYAIGVPRVSGDVDGQGRA